MATITSFSPSSARAGDTLRIKGTGLDGVMRVFVGGALSPRITFQTEAELWCIVPSLSAVANPVEVEANGARVRAPGVLANRNNNGAPRFLPTTVASAVQSASNFAISAPGTIRGTVSGAFSTSASEGAMITSAANGVMSGVSSITGQAFNLGAQIGSAILKGALSPFGPSGAALATAGGAALHTGASLAGMGAQIGGSVVSTGIGLGVSAATLPLNLAAGVLGAGGSLLSQGGGALSGALGGAGALLGIPAQLGGAALSGLGSVISMTVQGATKVFDTLLKGAEGFIQRVSEGLGKLAELGGVLFQSILDVASDVLSTAKNLGKQVSQISYNAGVSPQVAAGIVNSANFAGINTGTLANAYASPMASMQMGMRAQMLGLPDPTSDFQGFLLQASARRQQMRGPMGSAMFGAMLGPQMSELYSPALSLGPDRLQKNFDLANAFKLPGNIGQLGGDLTAASAALGAFGDAIKITAAEVIIPLMPRIVAGFNLLIENKDRIVEAVTTVAKWVVGELPAYILQGGSLVLKGVSWFMGKTSEFLLNGFQSLTQGVLTHLPQILQGFDAFLNGMKTLAGAGVGLAAGMLQAGQNLLNSPVMQKVLGWMGVGPTGASTQQGSASNNPLAPANPLNPNGSPTSQKMTYGGKPSTGQAITMGVFGALGTILGFQQDLGRSIVDPVSALLRNEGASGAWDAFKNVWSPKNSQTLAYTKAGRDFGMWLAPNINLGGIYPTGYAPATGGQAGTTTNIGATGAANPLNPLGILPVTGRSPTDAFQTAQQSFLGLIPQSNFAGQEQQIRSLITSVQGYGSTAGNWLRENQPGVEKASETSGNWAQEWRSEFKRLADAAEETRDATRETARNTDDTQRAFYNIMRPFMERLLARVTTNLVEDATLRILGT